ncbi:UDP-N-acetyl glucosamine 2-epimerase [Enterococcus thailandicus]|uniref:non-hydrolyzing UDP-N-acetylglucosamine 2-epimerase n=1 Tax=Enterococcus thailandicus TaxID=417368 RepID=UPI00244D81CB|nr:UDP-N-acetylglucosamine 2-epimerase (non-hydrolyzing) [Enterococcus thailandicus]GMC02830.1 UDP-N-acetyl glucosamine 2-epimerase [Enterococcus thailandicus]GMC09994.1 UDP-N-acetyl glucosamine 2-epimerase [Enterococcus thailandicus]
MKKILAVFGTRPEAIKMAPIIKQIELEKRFKPVVVVTGQHRDMLDQVLTIFDIKADYDLDIMKKSQSLSYITASVLKGLCPILEKEKPSIVLVHGDTTTTLAASLASFYHQIPVGHVEAGLRTHDKYSPFPEEMNRVLTDRISEFYFAPTNASKANLLREGIRDEKIFVTGNTAIDAMKYTLNKQEKNDKRAKSSKRIILLTMHRRENQGYPMESTFQGVLKIAKNFSDVEIYFPVHKNPKVQSIAKKYFNNVPNIKMTDPLDVKEFHNMLSKSYLILTDSGGVQEEAPALNVPVLVLRDSTERPEGVEAGTLKLIGTDSESVYENTRQLLTNKTTYLKMSNAINPYGTGKSSEMILKIIGENI